MSEWGGFLCDSCQIQPFVISSRLNPSDIRAVQQRAARGTTALSSLTTAVLHFTELHRSRFNTGATGLIKVRPGWISFSCFKLKPCCSPAKRAYPCSSVNLALLCNPDSNPNPANIQRDLLSSVRYDVPEKYGEHRTLGTWEGLTVLAFPSSSRQHAHFSLIKYTFQSRRVKSGSLLH